MSESEKVRLCAELSIPSVTEVFEEFFEVAQCDDIVEEAKAACKAQK